MGFMPGSKVKYLSFLEMPKASAAKPFFLGEDLLENYPIRFGNMEWFSIHFGGWQGPLFGQTGCNGMTRCHRQHLAGFPIIAPGWKTTVREIHPHGGDHSMPLVGKVSWCD